jgi:hypothetical protein
VIFRWTIATYSHMLFWDTFFWSIILSSYNKMKRRRDRWKEKAVTSKKSFRYQRKEKYRIKNERNQYDSDLQEANKEISRLEGKLRGKEGSLVVDHKADLVFLALQLFLIARISFRGVARVLSVLAPWLGLDKTPCPQTVINWVTRLSISRMQHAIPLPAMGPAELLFPNGFFLVIDASIGLGSGKIMTVLALDANHYLNHPRHSPSLRDVHCVAVSVADTWTGDSVALLLEKVIDQIGRPLGYVKDGGADLGKAVRLLNEKGRVSLSIDDISHLIANLLKHEYGQSPALDRFIRSCGKVSTLLKQTILACLAPPKVSTKARFMNLHRLVGWASSLLALSPRGRAANGSMLQRLRDRFDQLPECKGFIHDFLKDAEPLIHCQEILKNDGLSIASVERCLPIIETIPSSSIRNGISLWIEKHLGIARELELEQCGMPITSDCIESLFGVAKRHGTGEIKDANRIAMRIPALCGSVIRQDAINVLGISVKDQQQWMKNLPSLIQQRREVFKHGDLERITGDGEKQNVELIIGSKSGQKMPISNSKTVTYENYSEPWLMDCEIQSMC